MFSFYRQGKMNTVNQYRSITKCTRRIFLDYAKYDCINLIRRIPDMNISISEAT